MLRHCRIRHVSGLRDLCLLALRLQLKNAYKCSEHLRNALGR